MQTFERNPKCHNRTSVKCALIHNSQEELLKLSFWLSWPTKCIYYTRDTQLNTFWILFSFFSTSFLVNLKCSPTVPILWFRHQTEKSTISIVIRSCGNVSLSLSSFFSNFRFRNVYIDSRHVLQLDTLSVLCFSFLSHWFWHIFHRRDNHNQWKRNCVK